MQSIKNEYIDRLKELDELLDFLKDIEIMIETNIESKKIYKATIINSLKSSILLIIYNIIEYTILNSVKTIEKDFKLYDIDEFNERFQSLFYKAFWFFLSNNKFESVLSIIEEDDNKLKNIVESWYFNNSLSLNDKCKIKVRTKDLQDKWIKWNIDYKWILTLSNLFDFKLC